MREIFEDCEIVTLSCGVSAAVMPRGTGPELYEDVAATLSFNVGLWTLGLGLFREDLVAMTRWTPDDAPKGDGQRLYTQVSLAVGAARAHMTLSIQPLVDDLVAVSMYAALLPMPDAVRLGGLAAAALYTLREREGGAS